MAVTDRTDVAHPLEPLTAEEIRVASETVRREHDPQRRMRFVTIMLHEPAKEELAAHVPGAPVERAAEVVVLDPETEATYEGVVDVRAGRLESWVAVPGVQPALMVEEYLECERLVVEHPDLRSALERRGIPYERELLCVDPVPAGNLGDPGEEGRRLCRALVWMRPDPGGNSYARPVEGIVGLVDLHRMEVIRIDDHGAVPVPDSDDGEFRADRLPPPRDDIRPLEITQPEGPSFELDGHALRWQRWSMRVGFSAREGLVLHTVGYEDGGRVRSILHRASICEMYVPYGDPSPTRRIQGPFDIGENNLGTLANSLQLGCDCLGEIRYLDGVVGNSLGEPVVIPNAICIHEEDTGILWKHWDFRTGETEVRRGRRLVVSCITTVGNYEYGWFWYFHQDGVVECEIKLTGIVSTGAVADGETPEYGRLVAPGLQAMHHQHWFSARLDFDLDGTANSVYEVESEPAPPGPDNPAGNAWRTRRRLLARERDAPGRIDPLRARSWKVVNPEVRNAVGEPVGYRLVPGENTALFAQPDSPQARRAGFLANHVWVTRHDPRERYPAGDYPNQHPGGAGLPEWIRADRDLEGEDVVLWYSFGHHHVPRPEDWPVMPVARIGFQLKPDGFFDRNPALDVPPPPAACH